MSLTLPPLPYALDALEPHHFAAHPGGTSRPPPCRIRGEDPRARSKYAARIRRRSRRSCAQAPSGTARHSSTPRPRHGTMRSSGRACARAAAARRTGRSRNSSRTASAASERSSQQFVTAAGDHFGSGWAWLVLDGEPIADRRHSERRYASHHHPVPLLTIDVWEHAYYLDYQHRRLDYIAAFLAHLVNWDFANQNLSAAQRARAPCSTSAESTVHVQIR